ncbi:dihydrofolate reductase family protein [Arthrobacter sp. zg-Y20]|uniref:dihydrofolate reductase family protein n=1 Tax=unclassified Arthrobacter TaxID=235627 RepID=UPI001D14DFDC|nr:MULTISPECIES: dihydrofolate reductase family protein [unclassified Arthrobacter]MCC3274669.1 dihydrofolate reductase family protein [Arthrobacter sp. zg-Y20]MDK1314825.1 dihydrofolate reductase family protein [Arthrobacter sp. zg.Y20]WIB04688.1 dihydrofolate reductase family protein [Arthrobacter sp. zg-Y20]
MVRTVYYASASLDGFDAAGHNPAGFNSADYLAAGFDPFSPHPTEAAGTEVPSAAGAVVMGAGTYARLLRQVQEHGPAAWDCPQAPVWVYTHHEFPGINGADVMFVRGPVSEFAADIADSANNADVWLRGTNLAAQYLREGLLDELHLTLHPLLLGSGQALLPAAANQQVRLLRSEPSADGSMRLHYSFLPGA